MEDPSSYGNRNFDTTMSSIHIAGSVAGIDDK